MSFTHGPTGIFYLDATLALLFLLFTWMATYSLTAWLCVAGRAWLRRRRIGGAAKWRSGAASIRWDRVAGSGSFTPDQGVYPGDPATDWRVWRHPRCTK